MASAEEQDDGLGAMKMANEQLVNSGPSFLAAIAAISRSPEGCFTSCSLGGHISVLLKHRGGAAPLHTVKAF